MRVLVDLSRCESYGQCVFLAPKVFRFNGAEALEFEYAPEDAMREEVAWAATACPTRAITLDYQVEEAGWGAQRGDLGESA
jgi:ferredoxin